MTFRSLTNHLALPSPGCSLHGRCSHGLPGPPAYRHLAFEQLEDRRLLAVMTTPSADANALRDALLPPGTETLGDARLVAGNDSSGFFSGGSGSIGIASGILLASGPVQNAEPGVGGDDDASGVGDPLLDEEFDVTTTDSTALEFEFTTTTGRISFNYVFASQEYNEFANTSFNDAFALFVDGVNIALLPGTSTPISVNNVNGGNPLGTGAVNAEFFNNNDAGDGGPFRDELNYDGFTDVLRAEIDGLSIGTHTIRMTISDTSDTVLDSGVFIEADSLTDRPPGASLGGAVYKDVDGDGSRDPGEEPLSGVTIFLDTNGNGTLDPAEPSTVSRADGAYQFRGLPEGTYVVREVLPEGSVLTEPDGGYEVEVGLEDDRAGLDFGNIPDDGGVDPAPTPETPPTTAVPINELPPNEELPPVIETSSVTTVAATAAPTAPPVELMDAPSATVGAGESRWEERLAEAIYGGDVTAEPLSDLGGTLEDELDEIALALVSLTLPTVESVEPADTPPEPDAPTGQFGEPTELAALPARPVEEAAGHALAWWAAVTTAGLLACGGAGYGLHRLLAKTSVVRQRWNVHPIATLLKHLHVKH